MPNALFVDVSNLNTLFKVGDRFVLGTSYLSCPDRIAIDAQALGASYDIYLSMLPRPKGEGDGVISALSIGGVPFTVLKEEVDKVIKLVENTPGVGTVYICNALANFAINARVPKFESVINYGSRVALFSVKDKMLETLKVYDSQSALFEDKGEEFTCYGDIDLLDVDAMKSQYSELSECSKSALVALAPLIASYHSPYNVDIETVKAQLGLGEYAGTVKEKSEPEEERRPVPVYTPPVDEEEDDDDDFEEREAPRRVVVRKARLSVVNVLLTIIIIAGCAWTGIGYGLSKHAGDADAIRAELTPYQTQTHHDNVVAEMWTNAYGFTQEVLDLVDVVNGSEPGVHIYAISATTDSIVIECNAANSDVMTQLVGVITGNGYSNPTLNELDAVQSADGTTSYNYRLTVAK